MKRILAVAFAIALLLIPASRLLAKGATTRIVIEGGDLAKPIEITDRNILANFHVWAGAGTSSSQHGFDPKAPSFIIDWSQGSVAELPQALQKYQVSFYSDELSKQRPVYVVNYAICRGSEKGLVYLPGKSDEWWGLNVGSILRGVEGKWFHAWSKWEAVARPLIEKARAANSTHPAGGKVLVALQTGGELFPSERDGVGGGRIVGGG